MTAAVHDLAGQVWDARHGRRLKRDATGLARALALCVAQDVRDCPVYDPETDARVGWLREMIEDMRTGPKWRCPRASVDAEFRVLMVLGRLEAEECGKMAAAGG
jgi:hypothetical protein